MIDPTDYSPNGGNVWDYARREYLSGVPGNTVCQRYGMSISSFRAHARRGGWRRMDQPDCNVPPEDGEFHPDDEVSFGDLADQVFINIRRAVGTGRAAEASSWMRLYDKLCDRGRPDAMAALPDHEPPPPPESDAEVEPILLLTDDADDTVDLDSLDSVFPQSDPAPDTVAKPEPAADLDAGPDPDLDSLDSVFPESISEPVPDVKPLSQRERAVVELARAQQRAKGEDVSEYDDILAGLRPFPVPLNADGRPIDDLSP